MRDSGKRVAVLQSNYIPWKGYFDLISYVDEFVLYDDVQYTRRDWRNRNHIKTPRGPQWLTVPVRAKGKYYQSIRETAIDNSNQWSAKHWQSIVQNYGRASCFEEISDLISPLYQQPPPDYLSALNQGFIKRICEYLGIETVIRESSEYDLSGDKSERLAGICEQAGASEYVSGPAAKVYLDETPFRARGIAIRWFDYSGYPEYPQLWGDFTHHVSILDLLFNCGPTAGDYMRFVRASVDVPSKSATGALR